MEEMRNDNWWDLFTAIYKIQCLEMIDSLVSSIIEVEYKTV